MDVNDCNLSINKLKPFVHSDNYIKTKYIDSNGKLSNYACCSNLYLYNNAFMGIVNSFYAPIDKQKGYINLGTTSSVKCKKPKPLPTHEFSNSPVSDQCLLDILQWSQDFEFKLVFVISPMYYENVPSNTFCSNIDKLIENRNNIFVLDYSGCDQYLQHSEWFYDYNYLNNFRCSSVFFFVRS